MLLGDHMRQSGETLFRWRSYVLLIFVPFIALSVSRGEVIEITFGESPGDIYEAFCIGLVVLGEAIRILTVGFVPAGTSGRNTKAQIAKSLNTTGLYSLTRNPLYLGNCLMYLGVVGFSQNLVLTLILGLVLWIYYERIILAEESFLAAKYGRAYEDWAARVPAFFPRFGGWHRPALPFCLRTVIKREHASIFGAFVMLWIIEVGTDLFGGDAEGIEPGEAAALALAVAAELTALLLKKRTSLLQTEGR